MLIDDIRTPAFLIDLEVLKKNCAGMVKKAISLDLDFRPHIKTHKTLEGARYQLYSHNFGITVSTMAEAEFFAENDFLDITYAYPITADKLPQVAEIMELCDVFRIVADHPSTIKAIQNYGDEHDLIFDVLLKVDTGSHRAGLPADSDELISAAQLLNDASQINYVGILSHNGATYSAKNLKEIKDIAEQEIELLEKTVAKLKDHNLEPEVVSIGDTPGCSVLEGFGPATEIRPGNYIFYDKYQADIGSCSLNNISAYVLTRVIAHYPDRNTLLVDAGALALSKDLGATHLQSEQKYGEVLENKELKLERLSQEHGVITSSEKINYKKHPIGSFLTIIPNHSCMTAALFPHYVVVDSIFNRQILDTWKPIRGW